MKRRNQFSYASNLSLSVLSKYLSLIHPSRKKISLKQKAVINLDTAHIRMLFLLFFSILRTKLFFDDSWPFHCYSVFCFKKKIQADQMKKHTHQKIQFVMAHAHLRGDRSIKERILRLLLVWLMFCLHLKLNVTNNKQKEISGARGLCYGWILY